MIAAATAIDHTFNTAFYGTLRALFLDHWMIWVFIALCAIGCVAMKSR
ncbi:MAG TPA: hypothetical protein VGB55_12740 [Tepidisphaeraceae bacterium]|jgi:hypothetical protein